MLQINDLEYLSTRTGDSEAYLRKCTYGKAHFNVAKIIKLLKAELINETMLAQYKVDHTDNWSMEGMKSSCVSLAYFVYVYMKREKLMKPIEYYFPILMAQLFEDEKAKETKAKAKVEEGIPDDIISKVESQVVIFKETIGDWKNNYKLKDHHRKSLVEIIFEFHKADKKNFYRISAIGTNGNGLSLDIASSCRATDIFNKIVMMSLVEVKPLLELGFRAV